MNNRVLVGGAVFRWPGASSTVAHRSCTVGVAILLEKVPGGMIFLLHTRSWLPIIRIAPLQTCIDIVEKISFGFCGSTPGNWPHGSGPACCRPLRATLFLISFR